MMIYLREVASTLDFENLFEELSLSDELNIWTDLIHL